MKYLKYNAQDTSYFFTKISFTPKFFSIIYLFIQDIHLFKLFLRADCVLLTLTSNRSSRSGTDPILFIALFPVFSGVPST